MSTVSDDVNHYLSSSLFDLIFCLNDKMIAQNKNISDVSVTSSRQKLQLLSSRKGKAVSINTHKNGLDYTNH